MLVRICGTCGASFGACAITVASTLLDRKALRPGEAGDVTQQHSAVGILPARIGIRKMRSDVAQRERAQDRVDDRVEQHIGIGVTVEPALERDGHAAQHEAPPGSERMHVEAVADADRHVMCPALRGSRLRARDPKDT